MVKWVELQSLICHSESHLKHRHKIKQTVLHVYHICTLK